MSTGTARAVKHSPGSIMRDEARTGWGFILPSLTVIGVFVIIPLISAIGLSFTDANSLNFPGVFVGLRNYLDFFTWDFAAQRALFNTLLMAALNIPLGIVFGLTAALLVNEQLPGRTFFRWGFLVPVAGSAVAVSMMWILVFEPSSGGFLNYILLKLGIIDEPQAWLGNVATAMPAVIVAMVGNFGFRMLIYLSALQGIPLELYEAAKIDGAGRWAEFRYVTWPQLMPATFFIIVNNLASALRMGFDQVYVLTGGGPMDATKVISLAIYENAFVYNQLGYSAALSVVVLIVTAIITLTIGRYIRRKAENAF